jgi:hypothetical protein
MALVAAPSRTQVPGQPAPAGDRVAKGQAMIWTAAAWQLSNRLTR